MYRYNQQVLANWYSNSKKKPLVIRGARQVGKSTLVKNFATEKGLILHEVNLEKDKRLTQSINELNVASFLTEVQLINKKGSALNANTILFIDEIQAIPEALSLLRYLYEEQPNLAVIAAGSLLEFSLADENKKFSMPVGRTEYLFQGPCTFKEFLLALKETTLLEYLQSFTLQDKFLATAHQQLLDLFGLYLNIGGMPEAIQTYADTRDLALVHRVHNSILLTYRDDFSKYSKRADLMSLQKVFDYAPNGVGKKVKYVNIDPLAKSVNLKNALWLLELAGVIRCAYSSDALKPPLGSMNVEDIFKLYFLDCGLLNTLSGQTLFSTEYLSEKGNQDKLTEQFIAQHLSYLHGAFSPPSLFYWLREGKANNAEVDFLFEHNKKILPVEVKSGIAGTLKSLHSYVARGSLNLAVRFDAGMPSQQDVQVKLTSKPSEVVEFKLVSLPFYLVEELERLVGEYILAG